MTGTLHIIAATLALLAGLAVFGRPRGSRVRRLPGPTYAALVARSWFGLLAAGAPRLAAMGFPGRQGLTVPGTSLAVCVVVGGVIHTRMPFVLRMPRRRDLYSVNHAGRAGDELL